jgi:hypothetical protein
MDEPSWEPALTYRLPENPDIELLNRARTEVLIYLDFVTNDGAQCEDVSADINRAAACLIEIAEHWPAAIDANVQARLAAERIERAREWRNWLASRNAPDLQLVPPSPK